MQTRDKILPIILPRGAYERLTRQARANERDPVQEARWIIKQALGASDPKQADSPDGGRAA